jgi:6-pyruvoyltetrahydropterin/6-carboxytetrahydropterin synthase
MPFEISIIRQFSAAHQLRLHDGSHEDAHQHDWRVRVTVAAPVLDSIGMVMDFRELGQRVDAVLAPWRERRLNDLPAFSAVNASAENLALHIAKSLALPAGIALKSVEVWETPESCAVYRT